MSRLTLIFDLMDKKMSFQKRFGLRVKELRKMKNLTQEELSQKSGLNYKYIGAVERGERNLSLKSIKKIADGLHVETKTLFDLSSIEVHKKALSQAEKKKELTKISRLLKNTSISNLRLAYKLLKALFE